LVQNDVIYDRTTSRADAVVIGSLIFKMSNHLNNGNYTLVASNTHGTSNQTVSAMFLQAPSMQPEYAVYTEWSRKILHKV